MRLPNFHDLLRGGRRKLLRRYLTHVVGARRRKHDLADVFAAIAHVLRTGVPWASLDDHPGYPPASTVYYYFAKWSKAYAFDELNRLLVGRVRDSRRGRNRRRAAGLPRRRREPTACVIDSQSIKSRVWGWRESRGFDGHKKVNGVKYHAAVDTEGHVLACVTTAANVHDSRAVPDLLDALRRAGYHRLRRVYADAAYRGCEGYARPRGFAIAIVKRSDYAEAKRSRTRAPGKPFVPLPKRWVVERTSAHQMWHRRLTESHDRLDAVVEAWFLLGSITLLLRQS